MCRCRWAVTDYLLWILMTVRLSEATPNHITAVLTQGRHWHKTPSAAAGHALLPSRDTRMYWRGMSRPGVAGYCESGKWVLLGWFPVLNCFPSIEPDRVGPRSPNGLIQYDSCRFTLWKCILINNFAIYEVNEFCYKCNFPANGDLSINDFICDFV